MPDPLPTLQSAFAVHGLRVRGMLAFTADERAPEVHGQRAATLVLVGHLGGTLWKAFSDWLDSQPGTIADPLDTWSRQVLDEIAGQIGAEAVFPFDKPYWPFQSWAMRAEGLRPSPIGPLMHPVYGTWYAYRGALAFREQLPVHEFAKPEHACDTCVEKPCLSACPVNAFSPVGFDVAACRSYLRAPVTSQSDSTSPDCLGRGCHARNACPVGAEHRYGEAQLQFHMAALKPS